MTRDAMADAIVIGAGVVGAACARSLAQEGLKVTILERGSAGGGVTSAAMGHVLVLDDSPEQLALTALSVELWRELADTLPAAAEFDPCGTIWLAENDDEMDAVRAKQRVYEDHGIACEMIDGGRLGTLEPNLRADLAGGLRVPDDLVVYPPRAARALLDDARAHGATLREGCLVDEIVDGGVRCGNEMLEARIVVNAAGPDAARLTPQLPIVPRRGHLAISDRYPGFIRHQLVELGYLASAHTMTAASVAFNVQPRATGQVLIGSSRELVGWDAETNRALLGRMLVRAVEFMPSLAHVSIVRTWTGFRPATPDKLPLIGRWLPTPGLYIAAGHEGLGVTTSLGTARVLADLVLGRQPAIDAMAFSPMRVLAPVALAVH